MANVNLDTIYTNQFIGVNWDELSAYNNITVKTVLATNILAVSDENDFPQQLCLGATGDLKLESLGNLNSYTTGDHGYYSTVYSSVTNLSTHHLLYTLSNKSIDGSTITEFISDINEGSFKFKDIISLNSIVFNDSVSDYDTILTGKTKGILFDSPLTLNKDVSCSQSIFANGSIFGSNLNVWCNKTKDSQAYQIGYGLRVNADDELEIIKMGKYANNENIVTKRVAIFGNGLFDSTGINNESYYVFDSLNNRVSVVSGNSTSTISAGGSSVLEQYIQVNTNTTNLSIGGSPLPDQKLLVTGNAKFTGNLTTASLEVNGVISAKMNNFSEIGSETKYFKKMYCSEFQFSANYSVITDNNFIKFKSSAADTSSIYAKTIKLGDSNATLTLEVFNNLLILKNQAGNLVNLPIAVETNIVNNANIAASASSVYNLDALVRSGAYSWDISIPNNTITAKDAIFENVSAINQIFTPGSDFAECMKKQIQSDVYVTGDVVGIDINGELTKKFSEANHFMVVSGSPGLVGGAVDVDTKEMIGFCGRIPVNCQGAEVGHYIVPIGNQDDSISCRSISDSIISFDEYKLAVGKVISITDNIPVIIIKSF